MTIWARVVAVETAGKMTDCQIAAEVREYFCTEKLHQEAMRVADTIRLKILGMSAVGCKISVREALQSVPQVKNVIYKISDTVLVLHGGVSADALIEAVHEVGYGIYTL